MNENAKSESIQLKQPVRDIKFILIDEGQSKVINAYEGEFRNLMVLINEKIYVEDFGECKGIGRCGTCLVQIDGMEAGVAIMDRNEKITLSKCAVKNANIRLSCQLMINKALNNTVITVVDNRVDVR
jgi:ferredoxin, 2Fe-2S